MKSLSDDQKTLILVVNDDGLDAAGFKAAVRAAEAYGDVLAVAPARQQTGMGRAYPRYPDLGIIEKRTLDLISIYKIIKRISHINN